MGEIRKYGKHRYWTEEEVNTSAIKWRLKKQNLANEPIVSAF